MKNVLITGKTSYIGNSLKEWLSNDPNNYKVDTLDMRDELWRNSDFSVYDVVYHVAGIAHVKVAKKNEQLYFKVNRDLAVNVAKKAKEEGVKQFIFLSTMSVYGAENGVIDLETPIRPKSSYGKSKYEAEVYLSKLQDDSFKVAIIRPPMVYGKGCKGNYPKLVELTLRTPLFPIIDNKRSMIYIDNLSEFVKQVIDHEISGLLFPQNAEYISTSNLVRLIAEVHGKKLRMTRIFNPLLKIINFRILNKLFGDLIYDKNMSLYNFDYIIYTLKESITLTESRN